MARCPPRPEALVHIGRALTEFKAPVRRELDPVAALLSGHFRPIYIAETARAAAASGGKPQEVHPMSTRNIIREINRAKENIKTQRDLMENSELQTRIVLIDPMLRALGWNLNDPVMVRIEQILNDGRADYALFDTAAEQLLIIVEAKRLGDQKLEHHIPQAAGYAEGEGSEARYSVITNGNMWRVFENGNGLMRNSNILAVSIMSDPADRCAKELARLLSPPRPAVAMPFGEKTRRNQPAHGGIPTTGHLLDEAYGPLFTSPDLNGDADAQPGAGTQPGVEQPPLL